MIRFRTFLAASTIFALLQLGCVREEEIPTAVPDHVFSALCEELMQNDYRETVEARPIHILSLTQPIYRFAAMVQNGNFEEALARRESMVASFEPANVAAPPNGGCKWMIEDASSYRASRPAPLAERDVWAAVSKPVFNPFAKRGSRVGVFIKVAPGRIAFDTFPADYFWVPLVKEGASWSAGEIQDLRVIH